MDPRRVPNVVELANLVGGLEQPGVVAHPVGGQVHHPLAAHAAVVVGAGIADSLRSGVVPMDPLGDVPGVELVSRVESRDALTVLVPDFQRADAKGPTAHADVTADNVGDAKGAADHGGQLILNVHILPITRLGATYRLAGVGLVDLGEIRFVVIGLWDVLVLAGLLGRLPLNVEEVVHEHGDELVAVIDELVLVMDDDGLAPTELTFLLLNAGDKEALDHLVAGAHGLVELPRIAGVVVGNPSKGAGAFVADFFWNRLCDVLAHGVDERRRRDDASPSALSSVLGIVPQGIVVTVGPR